MWILLKIFHWLYTAPLLYTPFDWAMCVGQIAMIRLCVKVLKGDF